MLQIERTLEGHKIYTRPHALKAEEYKWLLKRKEGRTVITQLLWEDMYRSEEEYIWMQR